LQTIDGGPQHQTTRQGGPLSPLLANIVPDPLDQELECPGGLPPYLNHFTEEGNGDCMAGAERRQSRGHTFARHADDFIVTVKSANAAKRVLASLIRWLEEQGVPDMKAIWIALHFGPQARV
jgi:RNA-directed DNA polymerase